MRQRGRPARIVVSGSLLLAFALAIATGATLLGAGSDPGQLRAPELEGEAVHGAQAPRERAADRRARRAIRRAIAASADSRSRISVHDVGATAVEPTLGIDREGRVFYVASRSTGGLLTSAVMSTADDGATWQELDALPGLPNLTNDPYLYVDDSTGSVFNVDYVPPCSTISRSDDQGGTWKVSRLCAQHTDHQNLFAGPAPEGYEQPLGYPNVVYYCAIDGGATVANVFTGCSRSLDGGATFTRTEGVPYPYDPGRSGGSAGIPAYCTGATGHGTVGPDGTVYLPRGWCDQPYVAISRDQGRTWTRVQVSDRGVKVGVTSGSGIEEHEAAIALDAAGTAYYFWVDRQHRPVLSVSRDGGRTWGPAIDVAPAGVTDAWGPAIDAGDPGRIALAWLGSTKAPAGPFCVRTTPVGCTTAEGGAPPAIPADTPWLGYVTTVIGADTAAPSIRSFAVGTDADPLVRGECGPIRCQQQYDFIEAAVAPDGTAWASFADGCPPAPQACALTGQGIAARVRPPAPLLGTASDQRAQIRLPKRCRGRTLTVTVRAPTRGRLISASARAGRARAAIDAPGTLRVPLSARAARGRVVLAVRSETTTGRTTSERATYVRCRLAA